LIDANKIRLNSLYDPDYTYAGHQPMGFDQLATLYASYRVWRVSIRGTMKQANTTDNAIVTFVANMSNATISTLSYASEQITSKTKFINPYTLNTYNKVWDMPKITGYTPEQYRTEDLFTAAVGSDPTSVAYLHILSSDVTGSVLTNGAILFNFELLFDCEFFNPLTQTGS